VENVLEISNAKRGSNTRRQAYSEDHSTPNTGPESQGNLDSGLQCFLIVAGLHGIAADEAQLRHEFGTAPFTSQSIMLAAKRFGMAAKLVKQDARRWDRAPLPAIAPAQDGTYCVVAKYESSPRQRLLVYRPGSPPEIVSLDEFSAEWSGQLIYVSSGVASAGAVPRFDFSWFIPAVIKYRRLLGEVLLISLVLQIIGLCTPIFFQVVMDKVLVNHATRTLDVIAIGLFCAIVFDATLTAIRSYVFSHTTSKLDVELGARLFRHLLALPVAYFQSRRVGDSVARVRELEQIRSFLTGNALTVLLDVMFSFVFLGVMFCYSPKLTLIVVLSIPAYVLLSLIFTPILRSRLNEKFNRGAENQSFLVESISGMDTVKALAVEPRWIQRWEKQLASYVTSSLNVTMTGLLATAGVTLISKLVTLGIMWAGAWQVMAGALTVGELVAFNMLAGQVANPILRLAQLWNDFQQVGVSMQRLGDILNAHTEVVGRRTRLPRLEGSIEFEQVSFRYRPDAVEALRAVTFRIAPGEVIGVVGRSGSGKSTLTKLIQRMYVPERGRILVDGHDVAIADVSSLRDQIGVVLQENTLFNRSVRENIALSNPVASIEEIIDVAKLAGAHEFICELPEGYDTLIGENGAGLSGGQRQRVAIARALLKNPRILVMDEATSALDYESERIVQEGMERICQGRTVVIVAHRLSAVRDAHRIMVLERGQIAEIGSHDELMQRDEGIYAHLYRLQTRTVLPSPWRV
jgi:ATP-binding cassette, subfamily B, bacterial HlyB/CyaB